MPTKQNIYSGLCQFRKTRLCQILRLSKELKLNLNVSDTNWESLQIDHINTIETKISKLSPRFFVKFKLMG